MGGPDPTIAFHPHKTPNRPQSANPGGCRKTKAVRRPSREQEEAETKLRKDRAKEAEIRAKNGAPQLPPRAPRLPTTGDQNKREAPPRPSRDPRRGARKPEAWPRLLPAGRPRSRSDPAPEPPRLGSGGGRLAAAMAADSGRGAGLSPAAAAAGEKGEHVKPFTPERAKEIIMSLQQPAVFHNMVFDWPARHWTAKHLSEVLRGKQIRFRMGMRSTDTVPQFETACSYVEATLDEFLTWNCGQSSVSGPFREYDRSKFWAYADYKYFISLFEDKPDVFQDVIWSDFGFPGRNGQESTLWIGSLGAHTPCHLDSYGCNLVFQVQGRKRWHLFPPEDTPFLYPTRIPYEESSVFSKINVVNPDLKRFPQFPKAQRHTVTLSPGQVLFVPRHWWHYVESIDPITVSINSWIELEEDHLARVEEAITRMLVCALKTAEDPGDTRAWLNPTEIEDISHEVNCHYLNGAVSAFFDHYTTPQVVETQALRANGDSAQKEELNRCTYVVEGPTRSQNLPMAAGPFGPNLVPVTPRSEEPAAARGGSFESDSKDAGGECVVQLCRDEGQHTVSVSDGASGQQVASHRATAPALTLVSTDDLLDCLVSPQVTRMVAQLLIQGRSL